MYEGSQQAFSGFMQRQAGIARQDAHDAADVAWKWKAEADRLSAVEDALLARIAEQEARIAKLQGEFNVMVARVNGRDAQLDEMEAAHKDSPLLRPSNERFKDGTVKSQLRLLFEKAFDSTLRGIGITNPEAFRLS